MTRPVRTLLLVPESAFAAVHRRKQRVVVRAPGKSVPVDVADFRREHFPTLAGLGVREALDTEPSLDVPEEDVQPVSQVRARVAPRIPKAARSLILPPRSRPVTLLDEVDDDAARKYREEAERILASGLFDTGLERE
ncbi:MAG TPA: hypothetical protein VHE30_02820 [Polyangiaceae bacterium]|nr:hypothetical protein [Polyangiaceae bacterium]